MNILIDYLCISFNFIDFLDIFKMINIEFDNFHEIKSYYGMPHCYYFGGIKIHQGDYFILDMSGSGCRTLETCNRDNNFNWFEFIENILKHEGSHISRLDIAGDDKENIINMETMLNHVRDKKYICLSKKVVSITGSEQMIIFGSPTSDRRLRIYNKALEQHLEGENWVRVEFQLRNEAALSFFMKCFESKDHDIGAIYSGMLFDYLRFTTEPNTKNHTERLKVCRWWSKFTNYAEKIKGFYLGGIEYNFGKLQQLIEKQFSSSLKTYLEILNGDIGSLLTIIDKAKLNKKQQQLLDDVNILKGKLVK